MVAWCAARARLREAIAALDATPALRRSTLEGLEARADETKADDTGALTPGPAA